MAEIIAVGGVAITVPVLLKGAWTVLQAAYSLYSSVEMRRAQIGILLDRCRDLIAKVAQQISAQEQAALSNTLLIRSWALILHLEFVGRSRGFSKSSRRKDFYGA